MKNNMCPDQWITFFPLEMLMHIYICHGDWTILNFTYRQAFLLFVFECLKI